MARTLRLAVLVVALLVVGSVTAGTAAAAAGDATTAVYDVDDVESDIPDATLTDGGVYWQGQQLGLGNVSGDLANTTNRTDVETLHLRAYDPG